MKNEHKNQDSTVRDRKKWTLGCRQVVFRTKVLQKWEPILMTFLCSGNDVSWWEKVCVFGSHFCQQWCSDTRDRHHCPSGLRRVLTFQSKSVHFLMSRTVRNDREKWTLLFIFVRFAQFWEAIGFGSAFGRWQEIRKSGENLQILKKCELSAAKYVTALLSEPHMAARVKRSLGTEMWGIQKHRDSVHSSCQGTSRAWPP